MAAPLLAPQLARAPSHPIVPTWLGCDLVTGAIICELPQLNPQGPIGRRLGAPSNASFSLALTPRLDPAWIAGTQPGRSLIVCVVDDVPIWSGIIIGPRERGSANAATLTTVTPEGYLDRRYVGDHPEADNAPYWQTAATLLADAQGTNAIFTIDAPADLTPTITTPAYASTDDQTAWDALTAIMEGGYPEVVIDTVWRDASQTSVQLVARIREHVGYWDLSTGPRAVFDLPGCVTAYSQTESYESGHGANSIMAEGLGQSSDRITSGLIQATAEYAAGWPIWGYRWSPSQAASSQAALTTQAYQALALMVEGSTIWQAACAASQAPRAGIDFDLGDRVGLSVSPADALAGWPGSPGHPQGVDVQCRAWGWDLDVSVQGETTSDVLTPILAEDSEGGF